MCGLLVVIIPLDLVAFSVIRMYVDTHHLVPLGLDDKLTSVVNVSRRNRL